AEERLEPGENVSIALGFAPGTFTVAPEPPTPFLERVPLLLWGGIASLIGAVAVFVPALVRNRGATSSRAVIAQYEPPADLSVAEAAELLHTRSKAMTATLLDFAVRRKLRLLHNAEADAYGIQAIDQ